MWSSFDEVPRWRLAEIASVEGGAIYITCFQISDFRQEFTKIRLSENARLGSRRKCRYQTRCIPLRNTLIEWMNDYTKRTMYVQSSGLMSIIDQARSAYTTLRLPSTRSLAVLPGGTVEDKIWRNNVRFIVTYNAISLLHYCKSERSETLGTRRRRKITGLVNMSRKYLRQPLEVFIIRFTWISKIETWELRALRYCLEILCIYGMSLSIHE